MRTLGRLVINVIYLIRLNSMMNTAILIVIVSQIIMMMIDLFNLLNY